MSADQPLILTLAAGLGCAAVLGYTSRWLGLSPIVGYLLAGVLVGPHTPGFIADQGVANQLAELGVILLMFGVGLQFHIRDLWAVRWIAIPGAVVQCLAATLLGMAVASAMGWSWQGGLIFGLAVSVASTVVLLRVLSDQHDLHTPAGHIAVGWLVVEDLLIVLALVLLPVLLPGSAAAGSGDGAVVAIGWAAVKIAALMALFAIAGTRLMPWLLSGVAASGSRELFTLTVLALVLGVAVLSAKLFGVSMALGAFLAGLVVARSDFALRASAEAMPMRDAFSVLFFVSVGMLLSPADLIAEPWLALATLGIVLVGKPLAALIIVLVVRRPLGTALTVAAALAQIGEFSFMLMALGRELGLLGPAAANAIIGAAIISISVNPLIYKTIGPINRRFSRSVSAVIPEAALDPALALATEAPRAVVVGAGPVGRTLIGILNERGIVPVVVEMNLETVRRLRDQGISALYGDVVHPDTLPAAGIAQARALFLTASGITDAAEAIRLARAANPGLKIIVRADYLRQTAALRRAGADQVLAGEVEVAGAMAEAALTDLGAGPDQISAERTRVRVALDQPG